MNRWRNCFCLVVVLFLFSAVGVRPASAEIRIEGDHDDRYYVMHGEAVDSAGAPAPEAEIVWASYGGSERVLNCDDTGRFKAALQEGFGWFSGVYAREGEQVSSFVRLLDGWVLDEPLVLGPPAALKGRVALEDGTPLGGARIRFLYDHKNREAFREMATGDDGHYVVQGVPPGAYRVVLWHERYFVPNRERHDSVAPVDLQAGETQTLDFTVQPRARVSGKLTGPQGAPVTGKTFTFDDDDYGWVPVEGRTDGEGVFTIWTRPAERERAVDIEIDHLGRGKLAIPALASGAEFGDANIQLHGAVRLYGTVTGIDGAPLSAVKVSRTESDDTGAYDAGWIPLSEEGTVYVHARPPSWREKWTGKQADPIFPDAEDDRVYYRAGRRMIAAKHGDEIRQDFLLNPIPLRTVRGVVRDETGAPSPDTPVAIYEGCALAEVWLKALAPYEPAPPPAKPWRPRSYLNGPGSEAEWVARVRTDEHGAFEVSVPIGVMSGSWLTGEITGQEYVTVVAADDTLQRIAHARPVVDPNAEDTVTVDLQLVPIPSELTMEVTIADRGGNPLPGTAWLINGRHGPFLSDHRGRLKIPRFADRIKAFLAGDAWQILSVDAFGPVESVPLFPGDILPNSVKQYFGLSFGGMGRSMDAENAPPYMEIKPKYATFDFFDTSQSELWLKLAE